MNFIETNEFLFSTTKTNTIATTTNTYLTTNINSRIKTTSFNSLFKNLSFISTNTTNTDLFNANKILTETSHYNFKNLNNLDKVSYSLSSPASSSSSNSDSSDSKLVGSINLLKNIIDKLSKISYDNTRDNSRNKHDSPDSFDSLFALAKNSVTLSFKDYLLLHKSTNNFLNTYNTQNQVNNNQVSRNYLSSTVPSSSSYDLTTKFPSFPLFLFDNLTNSTSPFIIEMIKSLNNKYSTTTDFKSTISYSNSLLSLSSSLALVNNSLPKDSHINFGLQDNPVLFTDPISISATNNSSLLIGIAFFYSILIITSLTSNPLLIYVLLWRRKTQIKLIDIFVANLSLSDLFLTILNIPLCLIIYFSEQWPFGSLLCQMGTFSTSVSIYVNIFTMAYISIDRYFAVTRPLISNPNCQLRKKSILLDDHARNKIYLVLTLIWIIAIFLSLPHFLFSKVSSNETGSFEKNAFNEKSHNKTELFEYPFSMELPDDSSNNDVADFGEDPLKRCIIDYPYENMKNIMVLINFSLQYLIPSIVILYFYGKIIYHLYLNLNVEELMESPNNHQNHQNLNNNKKIVKSKSDYEVDLIDKKKTLLSETATINEITVKPTSSNNDTYQHENVKIIRKKSKMRIEGINRTRNLKKSIKTMIIIIALFLLSWLPIHLYRMTTTFYPIILNQFEKTFKTNITYPPVLNISNLNKIDLANINETCKKNETYKDCLISVLGKLELKDSNDTNNLSFKINTLHNRYVFFFCYFMAMSSVCYNPIVYFWMHKKFRAEVKDLFSRLISLSCRRRREETRTVSLLQSNNLRSSLQTNSARQSAYPKMTKFSILSKQTALNTVNCDKEQNNQQKHKRLFKKSTKKRAAQPCYVSSIKIRNKRFSSLSSESTASSSKKSDY